MTRRGLELYTHAADEAAARVIRAYSTSFGLASGLLTPAVRRHIVAIYALVRVADEIVDGPAAQAGLDARARRSALDTLESDTLLAMRSGFSANLIVHAFARTAREIALPEEWVVPFFASMRMDADGVDTYDDDTYRRYIFGSAEAVGVMCVYAFVREREGMAVDRDLIAGARRLGAAFQKINFLRDLADDHGRLGRTYFPGVDPARFSDADKAAIIGEIDRDLVAARRGLSRLPSSSRRAATAAADLFSAVTDKLRAMSASEVMAARVSVSAVHKARIFAVAAVGRARS